MKIYCISAREKYPFEGWETLILKVTKETKTEIHGKDIGLKGNQCLSDWDGKLGAKWVIIKSNIVGWKELK